MKHDFDLRGIFDQRELMALFAALVEADPSGKDDQIEYHEFAQDFKVYLHPRLTLAVATDELVCYRIEEDAHDDTIEPDAVKVNDKGWRVYVYKHLPNGLYAFTLTERVGIARLEDGRLVHADLVHIKRRD